MKDSYRILKTAGGWMGYRLGEGGVSRVLLPCGSREELVRRYGLSDSSAAGLRVLDDLLTDYFNGVPADFSGIPLDTEASEFQRKVYDASSKIPYGETRTYGWVARSLGKPAAARAVGNALRLNPTPLLVPCHRVVGSEGLGGFTPSLELKRRLLKLEGSL